MLVALREYGSLFYWWSLFHLNSLFLRFVYTVAPFSVLKKRIIGIFDTIGVKVTCISDKDEIVGNKLDKSKNKVELVVKDNRFFYKVFDASLGLGEAYMVRTTQAIQPQRIPPTISVSHLSSVSHRLLSCTEWND
jgi:hypothetical protein